MDQGKEIARMHQAPDESEINSKYPHMPEYKICMSNAFRKSSITMVGCTFSLMVIMHHGTKKFMPNIFKHHQGAIIVTPILAGIGISYVVGWKNCKNCSNMWLAMEGKHSILNPVGEKQEKEKLGWGKY